MASDSGGSGWAPGWTSAAGGCGRRATVPTTSEASGEIALKVKRVPAGRMLPTVFFRLRSQIRRRRGNRSCSSPSRERSEPIVVSRRDDPIFHSAPIAKATPATMAKVAIGCSLTASTVAVVACAVRSRTCSPNSETPSEGLSRRGEGSELVNDCAMASHVFSLVVPLDVERQTDAPVPAEQQAGAAVGESVDRPALQAWWSNAGPPGRAWRRS